MVDLLLLAVLALPAAPAAASAVSGLDCPRLAAGSIKVDGFFVDWQGSEGLQGIAPGSDLRWELRAARDAAQLYLVFGAHDDSFVPTPPAARPEIAPPGGRPWTGDHLELRFVATDGDLPASGQTAAIVVLPGDLEDRPPRAAFLPAGKVGRGGGQATSLVVDGATRPGGGWLLELALPFALLPPTLLLPDGLRLALRVHDADDQGRAPARSRPGVGAPPAAPAAGDVEQLVQLVFPEDAQNRKLLLTQLGLPPDTRPELELLADVGGDARRERVMLFGGRLTVLGEGLGEGAYYILSLPFADRLRPIRLEALEMTGDRVEEILLRYRVAERRGEEHHEQEFFVILQYAENAIRQLFAAEVIHEGPAGQQVRNEVVLDEARPGKGRVLRLRFVEANGLDIHSYRDVDEGYDNFYEEIILPWSKLREKVYRFRDGRFLRE